MFSSKLVTVEAIKWHGEDDVDITCELGTFSGAKRKDFFCPDENWEKRIKVGSQLKLWTIQYSRIIGIEWRDPKSGLLEHVWVVGNDFETKAQREASNKSYNDFIKAEGRKIAGWIDHGETLDDIQKLIDPGHSGNTYGYALSIGISSAKNKKNAEKIRKEHNAEYGAKHSSGVINPAILTIGDKE